MGDVTLRVERKHLFIPEEQEIFAAAMPSGHFPIKNSAVKVEGL